MEHPKLLKPKISSTTFIGKKWWEQMMGGKPGNLYKGIVYSHPFQDFFWDETGLHKNRLFPVILVGRNFAHGNFQISPGAFVVFSFSRPARSTKKASEVTMVLSLPPPDNEFQKKRGNGLGIWINPGVIHKSGGFLFMILQLLNEFEYGY